MTNPLGLSYVKVVGRYQIFMADSLDADDLPDFVALEGTGIITPNLLEARDVTPGQTSIYLPDPIPIKVIDGMVSDKNGTNPYVMLLTTSAGITPLWFNYSIKLSLRPKGSAPDTPYITYGPFSFDPVPAEDTGVVDLALVTPVTPNEGEPTAIGPQGEKGDVGDTELLEIGDVETLAGEGAQGVYYARDYGTNPDGIGGFDNAPAINAAIWDAHMAGGGEVILDPGAYTIMSSIGFEGTYIKNVKLSCPVPRGVRWNFGDGALDPNGKPWKAGAHIRAGANVPVLTGLWDSCEIKGLAFDADMRGSAAVKAHFTKCLIHWNEMLGWSGYGVLLNNGDFTDDLGYLNHFEYNNVSDTGEETGVAVQVEYRYIDSWIENNNLEAYNGADLQINSGGPLRVFKNHFNGNRSPKHNVLINGGVRELILHGNIFEGSREEALKYLAPGWQTSPERTSLLVNTNTFRQSNQTAGKPLIGIYGNTANAGFYMLGLTIIGNSLATDYFPTHAVELVNVKDASLMGNYWRFGHDPLKEPVRAFNCTGVEVIGNHGDNAVKTT